MQQLKTKKKKLLLNWLLIIPVLVGIVVLGYFFSTKDSGKVKETQENNYETEEMVNVNNEVVVIFEDEILENYIREVLMIPSGDINSTDMLEVYDINIKGLGVTNLQGLEYATELYSFSLSRENIKSLEPLKNLTNLAYLTISYSEIEELPIEFEKNENLNNLSIIDTKINDASFLKNMPNLNHLTMTDAGLKDISAIKDLNSIVQLNFHGNEIKDLSALKGKDKLETLTLQSNLISDISPLSELQSLRNLTLSYNPIYNLKPLETLTSLEELTIYLNHDVKHKIFEHVEILEGKGIDVQYHR